MRLRRTAGGHHTEAVIYQFNHVRAIPRKSNNGAFVALRGYTGHRDPEGASYDSITG
jgi:hypothetical protein